jgi:hypothetical protein
MVSETKCSIFFSSNVEVEVKVQVCEKLNIMIEAISKVEVKVQVCGF